MATKDQFGRIARENPENEDDFSLSRHIYDFVPNLDFLEKYTIDLKDIAFKICRKLMVICSTRSRPIVSDINESARNIFSDFAAHEEIVLDMFMASVTNMPIQVESFAALTGFFVFEFSSTNKKKLISHRIPEALSKAIRNDHYSVLKLLLRFCGAFVAYNMITKSSFHSLVMKLFSVFDRISDYRQEGIARAIVSFCKVAPSCFSDEELNVYLEKIDNYIHNRRDSFIRRFSPDNSSKSIVDYLHRSSRLNGLCETYVAMFSRSVPEDLPEVAFEFNEIDLAPHPSCFVSHGLLNTSFYPVIADLALDIFAFFGQDSELVAHQLLSLPMIIKQENSNATLPSLMTDNVSHKNSAVLIPIIFVAYFSDLFRIPTPYHKPIFHVAVLVQLFKYRDDLVLPAYCEFIKEIVQRASAFDVGCLQRFGKIVAHFASSTNVKIWDQFVEIASCSKEDPAFLTLESIIYEYAMFIPYSRAQKNLPEKLQPLLPKEPTFQDLNSSQKEFRECIDKRPDVLENLFIEMQSKSGAFDSIRDFFVAICYSAKDGDFGSLSRELVKLNDVIKKVINEEWKKEVIFESASIVFLNHPSVLRQFFVYVISAEICTVESFIRWFLRWDDLLTKPSIWHIFSDTINGLMALYKSHKQYSIMHAFLVNIFIIANERIKKSNLNPIAKNYLLGNIKEAARRNYIFVRFIREKIVGFTLSDTIDTDFKLMIEDVDSICSH